MREAFGDLFALSGDLLCITTNGQVGKGGNVMGGGCAAEARKRFPGIELELGELITEHGNVVLWLGEHFIGNRRIDVASFPTKDHWKNDSTIELVEASAKRLALLIHAKGYRNVLLPRPGTGLGNLKWEQVKPVLERYLDDRVIVVAFPAEQPSVSK